MKSISFNFCTSFSDQRPGHVPVQAGVGAAARGRTRQTVSRRRRRSPHRWLVRTARPYHTPPPIRHELCVNARHASCLQCRWRRLSQATAMGGHRQQHTEHRSRERRGVGGGPARGQTWGRRIDASELRRCAGNAVPATFSTRNQDRNEGKEGEFGIGREFSMVVIWSLSKRVW